MRRPNLRLSRRAPAGWHTLLKVCALPLVVLLLAAGNRQKAVPAVAVSALLGTDTMPVTAGALPRGGGVPSDFPPETAAQPPPSPGDDPTAMPGTRGPASTPAIDPPPLPTRTPLPRPTHTPTQHPTATPTPTPLLPTPDGATRAARVPILMYHHIEVPPAGSGELRRSLSVTPSDFEQQLLFLEKEGYHAISLRDLALHLTRGTPLPERPVILTFDDGYRDNYTYAFPLLRRFGFTATFFLVTAPIDAANPDFVSWEQVGEMSRAGMSFEPHSLDHPDMRDRSVEFLVYQVLASKGAIEERTGEACRFFAYPSGRYDQKAIDVLRSADFWGAVLTEQGATHTTGTLFELQRVRVQPGDSLDAFAVKLTMSW